MCCLSALDWEHNAASPVLVSPQQQPTAEDCESNKTFLPYAAFCQGICHNRNETKILLVHLLALQKVPERNQLKVERWPWLIVSGTSVHDHLPRLLSVQG